MQCKSDVSDLPGKGNGETSPLRSRCTTRLAGKSIWTIRWVIVNEGWYKGQAGQTGESLAVVERTGASGR